MELKPHWLDTYERGDCLKICCDLSLRHARLGGEVGSVIARFITGKDWASLCNFELSLSDPAWNISELIHCRQALAYFQKNADLDIGVDRKDVAYRKFEESEVKCKSVNGFFYQVMAGNVSLLPGVCRDLFAVRRKIFHVLGPVPSLERLRLRFGPGSTTGTRRSEACPSTKMADGLACSEELLHSGLLPSVLREVPHWSDQFASSWYIDDEDWLCQQVEVRCESGNLEFVPKNAKTDRSIVVEPILNSMVQLGIGRYIEDRLRPFGIDIKNQATENARLAREGSITGGFATLDLSSASDSVSRGLVKFLLPPAWYDLLKSFRTGTVKYKKRTIVLEKFSSMGNGFTFPLETLIFWAIAHVASNGETTSVFGDDIICPTQYARRVISLLETCGFTVNTEKSFVEGPFRESCGHDYYLGIDTRPLYVKDRITCMDLFRVYNFYSRQYNDEMAEVVRSYIHPTLQLWGPDGYGDGHLLERSVPTQPLPAKLLKKGFCGRLFETLQLEPLRRTPRYPGDYVSPLYSIYTRSHEPDRKLLVWGILRGGGDIIDYGTPVRFSKGGFPLWDLPGRGRVKKVSIYTLA